MTANIITSVAEESPSDMFQSSPSTTLTQSQSLDNASSESSQFYSNANASLLNIADNSNSSISNRSNRSNRSSSLSSAQMLIKSKSCPTLCYDQCKEFVAFAGDWFDSKGQTVMISAWGVIRYPNNAKLRFEAVFLGPNLLSVTFDKDPKKRKFVGKLSHDCELLVWSNDTKWSKKGSKHVPAEFACDGRSDGGNRASSAPNAPQENNNNLKRKNPSCLVM